MEFATPESATLLLWTLMRGAALVVLATEAMFLWTKRREAEVALSPVQAAARIFWAATPALLLAGLALWCLSSVVNAGAGNAPAMAQLTVPR
jgi:heme/copper-type cytochrome/quinol oxidase subunit 2